MTKSESKIVLERTYNVPLRKEFLKVPRYKRAKKAVRALKEFLEKHMKSDDVRIGTNANLKIWEKGIKNPPHHIKVDAKKYDDGIVRAEIVGAVEEVKEEKKPTKTPKAEKKPAKKETPKAEEKPAKKEAPKAEEKPAKE